MKNLSFILPSALNGMPTCEIHRSLIGKIQDPRAHMCGPALMTSRGVWPSNFLKFSANR